MIRILVLTLLWASMVASSLTDIAEARLAKTETLSRDVNGETMGAPEICDGTYYKVLYNRNTQRAERRAQYNCEYENMHYITSVEECNKAAACLDAFTGTQALVYSRKSAEEVNSRRNTPYGCFWNTDRQFTLQLNLASRAERRKLGSQVDEYQICSKVMSDPPVTITNFNTRPPTPSWLSPPAQNNQLALGFSECSDDFFSFLMETALTRGNDDAGEMYTHWIEPLITACGDDCSPGSFAIGDFPSKDLKDEDECASGRGMDSLLLAEDTEYSILSVGLNNIWCGGADLRSPEVGLAWTYHNGSSLLELGSGGGRMADLLESQTSTSTTKNRLRTNKNKKTRALRSKDLSFSTAKRALASMDGTGFDVGIVMNGDVVSCILDLVQTGLPVAQIAAVVVDIGLETFAMGISFAGAVQYDEPVKILTPGNGWTEYTAQAHWWGYIALSPEIPIPGVGAKIKDLISFEIQHYNLVNIGSGVHQTLRCLSGIADANEHCPSSFLEVIKQFEQTLLLSGDIIFNLEDATGGLLPDIDATLANAAVLLTAGGGVSGQDAGFYATFEANVMETIGDLADKLCESFGGILDLLGVSCPRASSRDNGSKIGLYVTGDGLGLGIDTNLFKADCKLQWDPLAIECNFDLDTQAVFRLLKDAGGFFLEYADGTLRFIEGVADFSKAAFDNIDLKGGAIKNVTGALEQEVRSHARGILYEEAGLGNLAAAWSGLG